MIRMMICRTHATTRTAREDHPVAVDNVSDWQEHSTHNSVMERLRELSGSVRNMQTRQTGQNEQTTRVTNDAMESASDKG